MNDRSDSSQPAPDGPAPHRRRVRYAGKYPKKFHERYKELNAEAHPEMVEHIRAQGRTPAGTHVPIMVREVLECLAPRAGEIVVDGTIGYGGHAAEFLRRIMPGGVLIGCEVDGEQLERTGARLRKSTLNRGTTAVGGGTLELGDALRLQRRNFAGIDRVLAAEGFQACDIIFADLGVSSMQIDDPARGFSYKHDGPLDMRMDSRLQRTAGDLLNTLPAAKLAEALAELADEPDAGRIAGEIVERRAAQPIARTLELVELIFAAKGTTRAAWQKNKSRSGGEAHPAARTFQALRILVNDEQSALRQLLRVAPACLRAGGRIGVLSFHSGENRLVKRAFQDGVAAGVYAAASDEVLRPTAAEVHDNPRSSAARWRWARKA